MSLRRPETSYLSQILTHLQESVNESATLEESMGNMFSDMPDLIDIPKDVLFQNYLYTPWM